MNTPNSLALADHAGHERAEDEAARARAQSQASALRRVYVKAFGCQMNVHDSERMIDVLRPLGFEPAAVPEEAVRYVGQLELVDVVLEDGTRERRFVRVGRRLDGAREILSGLRPGERVLLRHVQDAAQQAAGQSD